jgi:glycogen operon protein
MVNAYWEPLAFELPREHADREGWRRCIDTARRSPDDICRWADAPRVAQTTYTVQPRSVVLLAMSLQDGVSEAATAP